MGVRLVDPGNRMNFGEHQLGERILVGDLDNGEDVWLPQQGSICLISLIVVKAFTTSAVWPGWTLINT